MKWTRLAPGEVVTEEQPDEPVRIAELRSPVFDRLRNGVRISVGRRG